MTIDEAKSRLYESDIDNPMFDIIMFLIEEIEKLKKELENGMAADGNSAHRWNGNSNL